MKYKLTALAVLAALPFISTQAFAQSPSAAELEGKVFGSLFGEYYWSHENKSLSAAWDNVEHGLGIGAELGYRVNQTWGVRVEYARQRLDSLAGGKVGNDRFGVDAMYHLTNSNFYIVGGWKHYEGNVASDALNLGVGYRHFLSNDMALYAEANRYEGINNGSWYDAGIKLGATWIFGAAAAPAPTPAPAPAPAPAQPVAVADSDGDGVPDNIDRCPNTPAAHKVDAQGCTVFTEEMQRVGDVDIEVKFGFDSAAVSADQQAEVIQLAAFMKRFPESKVVIEGHASNIGNPAYNMRLSERRAKSVADILTSQGVEASRITSVGYGVTRLRVQGNTPAAHAANQRIEAKVTAKVKEPVLR
ncbi:membrane protein [Arsukibacterium ikkense]|uniref:Membrane protein n=1 Tax=Arsukibacterium ikkense TaxID=336831 RepID=A0A0M2V5H1_9GAMM|nr:OmpA family protein [Arsukibacterium ikkense]KKO44895.1 membrane protein [Arsukibacterium ikkense]